MDYLDYESLFFEDVENMQREKREKLLLSSTVDEEAMDIVEKLSDGESRFEFSDSQTDEKSEEHLPVVQEEQEQMVQGQLVQEEQVRDEQLQAPLQLQVLLPVQVPVPYDGYGRRLTKPEQDFVRKHFREEKFTQPRRFALPLIMAAMESDPEWPQFQEVFTLSRMEQQFGRIGRMYRNEPEKYIKFMSG